MNSPVLADSLRSIVYFVAVAKAGSFTAAADELGISKSALGKSIAKLEQHLSTRLLHRTTRKLNEQRLILCASPTYLEQFGQPTSVNDLVQHRCIMAWRGGRPLPWLLRSDKGDDIHFHATPHH